MSEGHGYYDRNPKMPRHLRGLSRLDHYILLRIRSGTDVVGHGGCQGVDDRFHLVSCDRYLAKRPRFPTWFNDKRVPEWRDWWQSHFNLGLGIPSEHMDNDGVVTVCGNPFQRTVTQLINGTLSLFHLGREDDRCTRCLLKNCSGSTRCKIPLKFEGSSVRGMGRSVALQWWPEKGPCRQCGSTAVHLKPHLRRFPDCARSYFDPFWHDFAERWDEMSAIDRNTTAIQWWLEQPGDCVCDWSGSVVVCDHLRVRSGERCLGRITRMFEVQIHAGHRPMMVGTNAVWRRG